MVDSSTITPQATPTPQDQSTLPTMPVPQKAPAPVVPPETASPQAPFTAYAPYGPPVAKKMPTDHYGSTYIPVDSWVYPAMTRLYSMGFLNTMFLGMRPWTRRSALHMLQKSQYDIINSDNEEAQEILAKLLTEFEAEVPTNFRGGASSQSS